MDVGIIGLPTSGKTTLFNALTGSNAEGFSERPNVGMADVPDPRLDVIASFIETQKIVPSTIKLVDIPGVAPGSDKKKLNSFLEHLRQVDAVCHVVRCFDPGGQPPAPEADIEALDTELALADLLVAESAMDKAKRTARSGDADAKARVAVLERVSAVLEEGNALRSIGDWTEAEETIIKSYGMITSRPVLFVANVGEDAIGDGGAAGPVVAAAEKNGSQAVVVCASLEAELAELDEADRGEMLESMGLSEPAIGPLARAATELLGLTTFYTAGEKEVRAWSIPIGAPAPEAAGAIHSDIQRGFIRAECYHVDDLVQLKNEKAIRDAGKLRSEGKSYAMQDGDVVNFLFNV